MRSWLQTGWLISVVALTGCMTTQRQARQESVIPLLEERIARLEERIETIEGEQRRVSASSWDEFSDATDELPIAGPSVGSSMEPSGAALGGSERFVKPSSKEIQRALQEAGYYRGTIDGKIGPKTQAAIRAFQKDHGLVVDGKVGRVTWGLLGKYLEG